MLDETATDNVDQKNSEDEIKIFCDSKKEPRFDRLGNQIISTRKKKGKNSKHKVTFVDTIDYQVNKYQVDKIKLDPTVAI